MVIDTSALTAIMGNEPERRRFNELIEAARGLSANEELLARPYAAEVEAARLRYPLKTEIVGGTAGGTESLVKQTVIRHYQPTGTIAENLPCTPPSLTRRPS